MESTGLKVDTLFRRRLHRMALVGGLFACVWHQVAVYGDDMTKTVSAGAGDYSFELTVSGRTTIRTFKASETWLKSTSFSLQGNAMKLSFHVDANPSTSLRTATLSGSVVNDETLTFTVIQEGSTGGGGSGGGSGGSNGVTGGLTQTMTVDYVKGSNTFTAASATGTMSAPRYTSSASWLTIPSSKLTNYLTGGGWSLSVTFAVTENTSSSSRTAVITGTSDGKDVAKFTVVQKGNDAASVPVTRYVVTFNANGGTATESTRSVASGAVLGTMPTATWAGYTFDGWYTAARGGNQVFATVKVSGNATYFAHWTKIDDPVHVSDGFGPGYGSDFRISASEQGFVVGFYGLTWNDFPKRGYDGYNVFTDSRIIDREKRSGSSADDHTFCVDYSYLDILLWGGWATSFSDEDLLGERLIAGGGELDAAYGRAQPCMEEVSTGSTFAKTLVESLAGADRMLALIVWFDNYTWYGERFSGKPGIGHGVVCCGYSYDPNVKPTDPTMLKGLFIIESDNDRENGAGGASAPDTITYCPVSWNSSKRRYEIKNIFGTTGYLDDNIDGKAIMIKAVNAEIPAQISKELPPEPSNFGLKVKDASFGKAQTVQGVLFGEKGVLVGVIQLKFGKKSKKGDVKLTATATLIVAGKVKKVTAKAVSIDARRVGDNAPYQIAFKAPIGEMAFKMAADGTFTLKNGSYLMAAATIGGALKGGSHGTFSMEDFDLAVPGELLDDLLPYEEAFGVAGTKWQFAKAASVKWAKDRVTKEYDLVVDTGRNGEKSNLSGLKLTYTPKTGQFKGSFKVYALQGTGKKRKLAKYTVNVIGFVVDGVGYGEASCKKPAATWSVTVE